MIPVEESSSSHVPAISAMPLLPLFWRARGARAIVLGGTPAAFWKAQLLAACGADLQVFAKTPCMQLLEWTGISLHARAWQFEDLEGCDFIIADIEEVPELAALQAFTRQHGIFFNVIDQPEASRVQFGAIVERSPLLVSISTAGAAPILAQAVRARIEAILPQGLRRWGRWAQGARARFKSSTLTQSQKKAFWRAFAQKALARPDFDPETTMQSINQQAPTVGSVALVGAGPGDPELLTLKAVRALQAADVVLYDDLIDDGVLQLARREAERIYVGKRGYKPSCSQENISAMIVAQAQAGRSIVRLKGGDPMMFGRATEEMTALRQAGIAFEIIPGVTSACAASAALHCSLSERDIARRVQFITGHSRDGHLPDDLNWQALADPKATTCIYMGLKTLPELIQRLTFAGLPLTTPAALVEKASWPDQQVLRGDLQSLPQLIVQHAIKGPALILIGAALRA